jgi:hypothetical protein
MKTLDIKDGTNIPHESKEHVAISMEDEWDEYYHQTIKIDREDGIKVIEFLKAEFNLD